MNFISKIKNWHFAVLFLCLFLTGCYSFNQITLPPETGVSYKPSASMTERVITALVDKRELVVKDERPVHRETADAPTQALPIQCAPFILPVIEKTPELPMKELIKAGANDPEALDRIQTQHIAELREYILKIKVEIRNSHNDYVAKCYKSGRSQ